MLKFLVTASLAMMPAAVQAADAELEAIATEAADSSAEAEAEGNDEKAAQLYNLSTVAADLAANAEVATEEEFADLDEAAAAVADMPESLSSMLERERNRRPNRPGHGDRPGRGDRPGNGGGWGHDRPGHGGGWGRPGRPGPGRGRPGGGWGRPRPMPLPIPIPIPVPRPVPGGYDQWTAQCRVVLQDNYGNYVREYVGYANSYDRQAAINAANRESWNLCQNANYGLGRCVQTGCNAYIR